MRVIRPLEQSKARGGDDVPVVSRRAEGVAKLPAFRPVSNLSPPTLANVASPTAAGPDSGPWRAPARRSLFASVT